MKTPLGKDVLLLRELRDHEALSTPFRFELEMVSESSELTLTSLLRESVTVSLQLADGSWRYINGRVCRFEHSGATGGLNVYSTELVPWFWLLSLTADCKIFQNKSAQKIVEEVFQKAGFSDFEFRALSAGQEPRDYCVQYRESSFNFVSRLLEEEGIYYFFEHKEGKHGSVQICKTAQWNLSDRKSGFCAVLYCSPES